MKNSLFLIFFITSLFSCTDEQNSTVIKPSKIHTSARLNVGTSGGDVTTTDIKETEDEKLRYFVNINGIRHNRNSRFFAFKGETIYIQLRAELSGSNFSCPVNIWQTPSCLQLIRTYEPEFNNAKEFLISTDCSYIGSNIPDKVVLTKPPNNKDASGESSPVTVFFYSFPDIYMSR